MSFRQFIRSKRNFILIGLILFFLFILMYLKSNDRNDIISSSNIQLYSYQQSYKKYNEKSTDYRFLVVSDMDLSSNVDKYKWRVIIKEGIMRYKNDKYEIRWINETDIISEYSESGRGMELSEVIFFNGQLLSCDDRSGIVFELNLEKKIAIPQWIFSGGDGRSTDKGFKCEWLTVKGDKLYVGSQGKEYTDNDGNIINKDNLWVKTVDHEGRIKHVNWSDIYDSLRKATGTQYPGYLIHEAVGWSEQYKHWLFLPRRVSKEMYDDEKDESRGSNIGLIMDEKMKSIKTIEVGEFNQYLGFSSFKFIPYKENHIVVLKTEENGSIIRTIMYVYDYKNQKMLSPEVLVSDKIKFEGIEIL